MADAAPVMVKNIGLREVFVADTKVSQVEGIRGKIVYRGHTIESLAEHSTFEETAYLLLHGALPTKAQLELFDGQLKKERWIPRVLVESGKALPKSTPPMDILQGTIPILAGYDNEIGDDSREANIRKAVRLISKIATSVATW